MVEIEYRRGNGNYKTTVNEIPHLCPFHKKEIDPEVVTATEKKITLEVLFRCPNRSCHRTYFAIYEKKYSGGQFGKYSDYYLLKRTYPTAIVEARLASCMKDISPNLEKIINQAVKAEKYGLDEISGMGYRKALTISI